MFVGHLAVGLAAKRSLPNVNLGWLIAGVTVLDLVWPIFVLAGIEQVRIVPGATAFTPLVFDSYPWTHSLVMSIVWGVVLAAAARAAKVPASASLPLVLLVVSHWVLDFVSHAPDMPLWPGDSPKFGLALWNSLPATFIVEGAIWIAGVALYLQARAGKGERPGVGFWSFVVVSTVMWATSPFSPVPPSITAVGWFAMIGWIVIPWAVWADRNRTSGP
jgi:membrane-bound metal-dependent hydrolase YbcI (DUF457 family)